MPICSARIITFPQESNKSVEKARKAGVNRNREGSVRNVNGKVYVDFIYLDERVRESSDLLWNDKNAKAVREQLDKIVVKIKSGEFRFAKIFPNSKKAAYFTEKELKIFGGNRTPEQILFKDYAFTWYEQLKNSGRVEPRTLCGYKSYLDKYLIPFLGDYTFASLNNGTFDKFISWAKKQKYRDKCISNETVNKIFVPIKMICKNAAIEYSWGSSYNPFFGFKKLPEGDSYDDLFPFSVEEQEKIIDSLSNQWKPYFKFAFSSGLRQGEQIAIKPEDIDWDKKIIKISRAVTRDEEGKFIMGKTKNKYSRRTIKLIPVMLEALESQKQVYEKFKGEYFFCTSNGKMIHQTNLRRRVWLPALKKAGIEYREMKQTRHSFATNALSCGENPLWIAKVMGHRNTDMIIKVYSKFLEDAGNFKDGSKLNQMYNEISKEE